MGERAIQGAKKTKQNVLETVVHFGWTKECFQIHPICKGKWVHDSGIIVYKVTLNVLFTEHRQYSCTVYFPLYTGYGTKELEHNK